MGETLPPDPARPSLAEVLRLFDETTAALGAQVKRLEEVLTQKQAELVAANAALALKVGELDALTRWLELVLGAAASGVIALDARGRITTANPAARALLPGQEPVGALAKDLFPDSPLLAVLADGQPRRYERHVGQSKRILACQGAPVVAGDGRILGAVEVAEDVSELLRLRAEAERADRLKQLGEMAAGVAHEIRNPLTGIEGFASMLIRDLAPDTPARRWAGRISQGVADLNAIVTGLLAYTSPRPPRRILIDPVDMVTDLCQGLTTDLPPDVSCQVVSAWRGGRIFIDPVQIRQVLLNVVQNAVHALSESTTKDGRIVVQVGNGPAGICRISIRDNGPGVDPAMRARLFQPFATSREGGTGLGLAVSLVLMQGHGGSLTLAESGGEIDGGGACFHVDLPATQVAPSA